MPSPADILILAKSEEAQFLKRLVAASGHSARIATTPQAARIQLAADPADLLLLDAASMDAATLADLAKAAPNSTMPPEILLLRTGQVTSPYDDATGHWSLSRPCTHKALAGAVAQALLKRRQRAEGILLRRFEDALVSSDTLKTISPEQTTPEGLWVRALGEGRTELGLDLRRWLGQGKLLCVEHLAGETLTKDQPFARLHVGEHASVDLLSPLAGAVIEKNMAAQGAVCVLTSARINEGWALWLVRLRA